MPGLHFQSAFQLRLKNNSVPVRWITVSISGGAAVLSLIRKCLSMENDMSKKYGTIKGKEKKIPESELIGGKLYLIDEEKCLYGKVNDDGIFYREEGSKAFSRQNARSADDNSAWPGPPIAFTR